MAYNFLTKTIHGNQLKDRQTGAVSFPIYQTSTFAQIEPGVTKGFSYSRTENPTRQALEEQLAILENARYAVAFASGLGAINTILLALLKPSDHIITCQDLYGGTYRAFTKVWKKFKIDFSFVNTTILSEIEEAITPQTKLLWLESPSNPLLNITDLKSASKIAKRYNLLTVVDNTFATPYLQQPLSLGADLVIHSTTKYLNGHADIIGGAVITNDSELYEKLRFYQNAIGAIPGPQDCFLTLRGIRTLGLRMIQQCKNTLEIAKFLERHPKVEMVYYPGLSSHPGYQIAKIQMKGFGGIVSFELKGDIKEVKRFATRTKLFTLAESLGAVNSLISHPASMTHASVEPEVRYQSGIKDNLLRLSVGIENVSDLIQDLEQAFNT
jgi:cystathionine beta-lyase/cystathionine gamma-synthase